MKNIITAINNPVINEEIKNEKNLFIIEKDIQYKEALLELIKKNKDVDIVIIYEKLPGEISTEELINKIKLIKSNIEIIFFLEKYNKKKIEKLKEKNIKKIYFKKSLNKKDLINIIIKKNIFKFENKINIKKIK